ncbi:hypothetical protein RP20_CCG001095 [Aedes albopictus]|nr:hypothetical protein RP20_CCG001095 [Aedes albopictus]
MSEDEAKVQSGEEEEEVKASPKKGGRGRPKKAAPATPASAEAAEEDIAPGDPLLLHDSAAGDLTRTEPEEPRSPEQWHTPVATPVRTATPALTAETEQSSLEGIAELPSTPSVPEAPPANSEFKVPPLPVTLDSQFSTDLQFPDLANEHHQDNQFITNIEIDDDQFQPAQNFQFAASDFDFLLSKGGCPGGGDQTVDAARDSLLLKFDPLLKAPTALVSNSQRLSVTREETPEEICTGELQELPDFVEGVIEISTSSSTNNPPPPPIIVETAPAAEDGEAETHDPPLGDSSVVGELGGGGVLVTGLETSGFVAVAAVSPSACTMSMNIDEEAKNPQPHCADDEDDGEADEKMSVDNTMILDGGGESSSSLAEPNVSFMEADQDFNGTGVSLNSTSNELVADKKSKNESLKIEELQKKLGDAELREEALLKRITEKDKTISKMSGVVEAYERAIADLITQKEQTTQSYEKTCEALKADSDINAQHLESLEKTFSDLHAKYERMKVITVEYKEREEELINERNRFEESLRMQEKRYENMKSHAMAQLDIANNKLAELVRNHAQEVTKLKALLKKEEIYRASVNEQLSQKSRENEELVKICEELINGGAN